MSTYNGERFIERQIKSILAQKNVDFQLFIRDDGSSDNTINVIKKIQIQYKDKIVLLPLDGNNYGAANSFMYLLDYVLNKSTVKFEFFSFADQDDYWLETKLEKALSAIEKSDKPALYFSTKTIVDSNLKKMDVSDFFYYEGSFYQYFTMSNAYGCTFMFNRKLAMLCCHKPDNPLIYHDAWIYRIAGCIDSNIVQDSTSSILYCQHGNNVVGKNEYWTIKKGLNRLFHKRNHILLSIFREIYTQHADKLNHDALEILPVICSYNKSFLNRFRLILWKEARQQGVKEYLEWIFKVIFNGI